MNTFAETTGGHPWFGWHQLRPAAPAETIRQLLRDGLRDTGWPYQPIMPAAPITIPRSSYAELFRVSVALLELVHRTALESAEDTERRLRVYRMPQTEDRLWMRDAWLEERYADSVARPDVVIGPDGPRFLEFNVSGAIGGVVETHSRLETWRRLHGDEAGRVPYASPWPWTVRAEMFRTMSADLAVAPRVAIAGSARVAGVRQRYFELEADYYNSHGLTARFFEPEELHEAWDGPAHLRHPIGLRNFTIADWLDAGLDTGEVQRAVDHGCLLVGTQTSAFLHHKLTLGRLSEGRPWMSAADRGLVARYVPWTRILADRKTDRDGRPIDLLPFVLSRQEHLVLKAGIGESGLQVVLGRDTTPAEWEVAVRTAAEEETSIVQDYVEPGTCRVPLVTDGDAEPHDAVVAPVLGPLLFGRRPAGLFCRFYGDGSTGIVSVRGRIPSSDNVAVAIR